MKTNKLLSLAVLGTTAVILAPALTGCGGGNKPQETKTAQESKTGTTNSGKRKVVDCIGREVEIPNEVKSVVGFNYALRYLCYMGCADNVVGVEEGEKQKSRVAKAYHYNYWHTWKDKPAVGKGGSGGYTPYNEQLISLKPDVIICGYAQKDAETLQQKTGIPVVVLKDGAAFSEEFDKSIKLIGEVMGKEKRAKELTDYVGSVKKDIEKRVSGIPEDKKPRVYTGAVSFKGGHGIEGTYSNFPLFKILKANDVAKGLSDKSSGVTIDKEKILEWNPDIIFLDPNNRSYVDKDYKENPDFYKQLKAFNEKKVYNCPGYIWYHSNIEMAVADTYYLGSVMYPEAFKDIDPKKKANEVFKNFLNKDNFYEELEKAGSGFGEFKLGD